MRTATQHPRSRSIALIAVCAALVVLGAPSAVADAPPAVTLDAPAAVDFNSAHLSGTVNPEGGPSTTSFHFEFTSTPADEGSWSFFGFGEFDGPQAEETSPLPVEAELEGIMPGTEYSVRLVAENEGGVNRVVSSVETLTTDPVSLPGASFGGATAVTASSAHFAGTVNSGGSKAPDQDTTYRFECSPECPGLAGDEPVPTDGADHEVEADAPGLEPNTTYTVRLVATNAAGPVADEAQFTTAATGPEAVTDDLRGPVSDTTARLLSEVNSRNSQTSYWFEYGAVDCAVGPCASFPAGEDADAGSGGTAALVGQTVTGLSPATTYHYRIVADNGVGAPVAGADRTFTTAAAAPAAGPCPNEAVRAQQGSTYLLGCRAYEMVSAAEKNQVPVNVTTALSPDRNRVIWGAFGGTTDSTSGAISWELATRTASGWVSRNVLPPGAEQFDDSYQLAVTTADLSHHVWTIGQGLNEPDKAVEATLVRLGENADQTLLHVFPNLFGNGGTPYVASEDLDHVFATAPEAIDPSHQPETRNVYDFGSGTPVLVSRMADTGVAPACGVPHNGPGFVTDTQFSAARQHWVSTDGSKVFFITRGDDCGSPLQLYRRDVEAGITTPISSPPVAGEAQSINRFLQAAADGSWVVYRTASRLDPADTDSELDIYRYDVGSGNECLTCVATTSAEVSGSPNNGAAVSEDGSHVYFVSTSVIDGQGTEGLNNLWLWKEGTLRYIAPANGVNQFPSFTGQVTPDGNRLLFVSRQEGLNAITGTDNGGTSQLYRYDDVTETLTCVSCPPGGAPATVDVPAASGALVRQGVSVLDRRDAMSEDGRVVAFASWDALLPQDVNKAIDLYEWRDGRVGLISNGTTPAGLNETAPHPELVDVSADGSDILFQDAPRLTADAADDWAKVYDARVGGGFLAAPPTAGRCEGEACLGGPASQAGPLAGGSEAFAGPASARRQKPRRCPKGKHRVKRNGKAHCVKNRANHHRRIAR